MSDNNEVQEMRYDKVIDLGKERFNKLAPQQMSFDAEKGYAVQLLANNDYLMKAAMENKDSLLQAITNVAAIGLSLNPAKKQAYLIPRTVKAGGSFATKVFLEPSYMGLCDLATMSGSIKWVQAACVYKHDTFEDNGPGEKPTHKYEAFASKEQRGDFVGVYCVAKTEDGDYLTTIMPEDEILSVRDRSESWKAFQAGKAKSGGPWQTDFTEQAKKTVVRRAFKMWPKTQTLERMEMAVQMSNENEGFEPIKTAPDIGNYTADQKKYFDQLIETSDSIGMFLFFQSLQDTNVPTALYNSFEKGSITKYKQVVSELEKKGAAMMNECLEQVNDRAGADDIHGVLEIISELSDDAVKWIMEDCTVEARQAIEEAQEMQEAG